MRGILKMNSKICEILGIEFPLVAFSHCKDVVAQVSKAGGMGVLCAVGMTPEILEQELRWIDENVDGKPYGLDLLVPNKFVGKEGSVYPNDLSAMIPQEHTYFRADVLNKYDLDGEELKEQTTDYSN
jgi:Dioxygenases related to 2-nitropropane dioxygenase